MPSNPPPVVAATQPVLTGLPPVHDPAARLLILGSFPGVASLQAHQYYAHPRNHFWSIVGRLVGEDLVALPYPARLERLRAHRIAVWDVIGQCFRKGSLDGAIREPVGQDFASFLDQLPALEAVAFNGSLASRGEPWFQARGLRTYRLPSTSPAHAAMSADQKYAAWRALAAELDGSAPRMQTADVPATDPPA